MPEILTLSVVLRVLTVASNALSKRDVVDIVS
jgi:hypothetical protein